MIKHIKLHGLATYSNPIDVNFKNVNFIYGGNGTGKTTLSRLISGEITSPLSSVDHEDCENEEILVYNKSFVDHHFREVDDISGIFTLGKDASEAQAFIEEKEAEFTVLSEKIEQKERSIRQLHDEENGLLIRFREDCWAKQVVYGPIFPKALIGARGAKAAFAQKCLDIFETFSGTPKSLDALKAVYGTVFSRDASTYEAYQTINLQHVNEHENHPLLAKKITGKSDSDIGRFIEYLGSSDWVKSGINFANKAQGKCPYCSQPLPKNIKEDIEAFFDVTYQTECAEIAAYKKRYIGFHTRLLSLLTEISAAGYNILNYDDLRAKIDLYKSRIDKNILLLNQKINTPSAEIELEPCLNLLTEIAEIILSFNKRIVENNVLVQHQKEAQSICSNEVWELIVFELKDTIAEYIKQKNGKAKAIDKVCAYKASLIEQQTAVSNAIREKRASFSNVDHTIDSINAILQGYGFSGFKLASADNTKGTYKVVRLDGTDAKTSLSEGEYNFITFLYYYHLIFGSKNPNQFNKSKIIMIDDPISSLDSNVLFIVSSLVKNIISFCRNSQHSVKQVIISTHNIYFHKEITFLGSRDHWPSTQTAFFVIRKKDNVSYIAEYSNNPIQSSYEMLWDDIRTPTNGTAKSIFNTMRRILENYFNIVGGIDYEKCVNDFSGEDKLICKSLISCINEQSHTISDDYYMCIEDGEIEHYLAIFREIFSSMGHISHYNMMMKILD